MTEFELFQLALDIDDLAARKSFLISECGPDTELLKRVESLLASHAVPSQFLETPVVEQIAKVSDAGTAATMLVGDGSTQDEPLEVTIDFPRGSAPMTAQHHDSDDQIPLGIWEPSSKPGSLGRLGHYEVLEVVGRGAFGTVLRGFDEKLQRVVAIKVMAVELATTSPARKRFLREAQASAAIRHENVVSVYAVEEKPLPYLVMEYIPGQTLQQRLNEHGPVQVHDVLRWGRQIAEGLAAAHAINLIHRDIKPGNILLESGIHDKVKITDFGLARAADDASLTQSGTIAGTPMYMAPEQALGQKLDQRADLFSLGSVLYQMVTGRPPFRAPSSMAVLKRVAEETPRPIQEIIPETPAWLRDIISKLHAKNPHERFQTAREVADLLAECEEKLKAKQDIKNILPVAVKPARWKPLAVSAVLLLPMIALAVTEFAGVTHLLRGHLSTTETTGPGSDAANSSREPTPVPAAKQALLRPSFKNSIGMEFVVVPQGKSWLGDGKNKPREEVEIPADFFLGKYLVTQEEWSQLMGENPSHFSRTGVGAEAVKEIADADLKRFPVDNVTWDQCQIFVEKLNNLENETGWVYRLPTEMEWEYACRGGPMVPSDKPPSPFDFYFEEPTNTLLLEQANFSPDGDGQGGLVRTSKVGSYKPNQLGLYDMHGNVWQWCADLDDPQAVDLAGARRALRGGAWDGSSKWCRATSRHGSSPGDRAITFGVRLARVPSAPADK